jgi:galactoside O-acetyltransferase
MSFLSVSELAAIGFKKIGTNVKISRLAQFYNPENIIIGNHVRIDAFSILSSGNKPFILENYIHIASGVYIWGNIGFHMKSFSNISAGSKIYTQSDSYCGNYFIGPSVPIKYRKVYGSPLILEKHVIIGAGSILLPGIKLGEGVAIGSHSLVTKDCKPWSIYAGSPAKWMKERSNTLLKWEKELL